MPGVALGFRVEGLSRLVRELKALGLDVSDLKDAFSQIAAEGARLAAAYAPVRSGRLTASIRGNRATSKAVVSAGYAARVPYAGAINYGWPRRGIRAAEFLQRADEALRPRVLAMLSEDIDRRIRERGLS